MEMKGVNESIAHLRRDEREQENQIKAIESDIKKVRSCRIGRRRLLIFSNDNFFLVQTHTTLFQREDALMSNGKVNEKMQVERRLREIAAEVSVSGYFGTPVLPRNG